MNNLPIKNKEDLLAFAKAYNRFAKFFLIDFVLVILWIVACTIGLQGIPVIVLFVPHFIVNIITLILMIIAAAKSKSSFCIVMCILYLVMRFIIPILSFFALLIALVTLSRVFKKYDLKINFFAPLDKIEAFWFCSCGNVCHEGNYCPMCNHYRDENGE